MNHHNPQALPQGADDRRLPSDPATVPAASDTMNHAGHTSRTAERPSMDHMHTHGGARMMHMGDLKKRFLISCCLALPVLLLSQMMGLRLPFQITFPDSEYVVVFFATLLFFYGGMPFLRGAGEEIKNKAPAMMSLISLGISVAYCYSLYVFVMTTILKRDAMLMDFFWELATLILIMLLGHWIEMRAISKAGDAMSAMAALLPNTATRLVTPSQGPITDASSSHARTESVPLDALQNNDRIIVKAGERIPADGKIEAGESSVDESMVTGEARSVSKKSGDTVIGGSINGPGTLTIMVIATGKAGYISKVMALVQAANNDKSRLEGLSDKVARLLFYVAVGAAVLTYIGWYASTGDPTKSLAHTVTVLIIACPHALGLAVPLVMARSTSLGASKGLLLRNKEALENALRIDTVFMDKTGTLTQGRFTVTDVLSLSEALSDDDILRLTASLEQGSNHPLAKGILERASEKNVVLSEASHVTSIPGQGLSGTIGGVPYSVLSPSALDQRKISFEKNKVDALTAQGNTLSILLKGKIPIGMIGMGDRLKPEADNALRKLISLGLTPVMVTGDNEKAALTIAGSVGIDDVHASLRPEDKEHLVREYQNMRHAVLMVGDGVNDAPALARADVGMAVAAGTDVAAATADVILVNSNPGDIPAFFSLARNTMRKVKQNLWWGAGYNIIAIPLAAGVLASWGIVVSPALGAVLMSVSTVIVALNAMTLRMEA